MVCGRHSNIAYSKVSHATISEAPYRPGMIDGTNPVFAYGYMSVHTVIPGI